MAKNGLLIYYYYCTGCHTCEVACQQENQYPAGQKGIHVTEHIYEAAGKLAIDYLPFPTDLCNLCLKRTRTGENPACVKHCQAACMKYGPVEELAKDMEKDSKTVLFSPR